MATNLHAEVAELHTLMDGVITDVASVAQEVKRVGVALQEVSANQRVLSAQDVAIDTRVTRLENAFDSVQDKIANVRADGIKLAGDIRTEIATLLANLQGQITASASGAQKDTITQERARSAQEKTLMYGVMALIVGQAVTIILYLMSLSHH